MCQVAGFHPAQDQPIRLLCMSFTPLDATAAARCTDLSGSQAVGILPYWDQASSNRIQDRFEVTGDKDALWYRNLQ